MLQLKESMSQYFSGKAEKHSAELPLHLIFRDFPESEVRLKTSQGVVFIRKGDMETHRSEVLLDLSEPSHAERVQQYFEEKEKEAEKIFKEASLELKKIGKDDLIKRLRTAVSFYESGDWIDEDNLARKNEH